MRLYFLLLSALLFASCTPCLNVDCASNDVKAVRYISKQDSADLFTTQRYDLANLRITPLLIDTAGSLPNFSILPVGSSDYEILLQPDDNTRGFVLQLDTLLPDTLLSLTGWSEESQCCGRVTLFKAAILNGDTILLTPDDFYIRIAK